MSRSPRVILAPIAGLLLLLAAASLLMHGWSEDGVRLFVRTSVRVSLVLLWLVFSASALLAFFPGPATKALVRHRRGIGLAFALSQAAHLSALVVLGLAFPDPFVQGLNAVTLVGGGIAYAFTALMAITSSDRAVRALGTRRWKRLHRMGVYYIWLIFLQSYVGRAAESTPAAIAVAFLLGGLALRAAHWQRRRQRGCARSAESA